MSRFTRYHQESLLTDEGGYYEPDTHYMAIVAKLGKLEDLEDELGCQLDVVFKALKDNEIYLTHNDEVILDDSPALCFSYEGWYLYTCSGFIEYLKDYKKTWWLKEDLSE